MSARAVIMSGTQGQGSVAGAVPAPTSTAEAPPHAAAARRQRRQCTSALEDADRATDDNVHAAAPPASGEETRDVGQGPKHAADPARETCQRACEGLLWAVMRRCFPAGHETLLVGHAAHVGEVHGGRSSDRKIMSVELLLHRLERGGDGVGARGRVGSGVVLTDSIVDDVRDIDAVR